MGTINLMPTKAELEFIREHHFYLSNEEMGDELGVAHSTIARWKREHLDLPRASERNRVEYEYDSTVCEVLDLLHNEKEMTTYEMAEALDVSRKTLSRWWEDCSGVPRRNPSEATLLTYENMGDDKRRQQTEEARKSAREKYGDGGYLGEWVSQNPNDHRRHAQEAAPLGAPAREENGMAGVTGQDNPNWRDGKTVLDAVKKQLRPSFSTVKDGYREAECHNCGAGESENGSPLDVHHIVPVLSGGTNDEWNAMTLCRQCHGRADSYIRQFDAFASVLTE